MLSIIIVLVSLRALVEGKSSALFCTHDAYNDFEVNRLQSIFTIEDQVYIRVGTTASKLWIYDIRTEQVLEHPVRAQDLFPGFPIVEFVAAVLCDDCPQEVSNLVIVIGRKDLRSYHKFGTFRLQESGQFVKINDPKQLPNWKLRNGEEEFTLDAVFYGFFPEAMVTLQTNSSYVHGFAFYPSLQIFNLKYYTEEGRVFLYRRLNPDGTLSEWEDTEILGEAHVLNSAFYMKDKIYSIDNDPQYMPRISHQIFVEEEESGKLVFKITDINVEAREFFNCFDKPTSAVPTVPVVPTVPTITATIPSTEQTSEEITQRTTEETTEETTVESTPKTTQISTEETIGSTDTTHSSTTPPTMATIVSTELSNTDSNRFETTTTGRNKGEQYSSLDEENTKSGKRGIPLDGTASSAVSSVSVRSTHDTDGTVKRTKSEGPTTVSKRSYHQQQDQPIEGSNISPSTASVRTLKT